MVLVICKLLNLIPGYHMLAVLDRMTAMLSRRSNCARRQISKFKSEF